jgi:hypothetical protein
MPLGGVLLDLAAAFESGMITPAAEPKPVRECNGCTLCCKIMRVEPIAKPAGRWCVHCTIGKGCGIHESRPDQCRAFYCDFLLDPQFDERWRPETAHFVMRTSIASRWIGIHVDPQRPDAWRREPYYSKFKELARRAVAYKLVVLAFIGVRVWAIYPDRDVDMGFAEKGDKSFLRLVNTPRGPQYELFVERVAQKL